MSILPNPFRRGIGGIGDSVGGGDGGKLHMSICPHIWFHTK